MKKGFTVLLLVLFSIAACAGSLAVMPEISSFPFALAKVSLGLVLFLVIDETIFERFNTHEEIRQGNIAAGLYFLGLCVLLASALLGS